MNQWLAAIHRSCFCTTVPRIQGRFCNIITYLKKKTHLHFLVLLHIKTHFLQKICRHVFCFPPSSYKFHTAHKKNRLWGKIHSSISSHTSAITVQCTPMAPHTRLLSNNNDSDLFRYQWDMSHSSKGLSILCSALVWPQCFPQLKE